MDDALHVHQPDNIAACCIVHSVLYFTVLHRIVLYCIERKTLYRTVIPCNALNYTLHYITMHCIAQHHTLLYCTELLSSILSRNMCKLRRKLRNAKFSPLSSKAYSNNKKMMSFYGQFRQLFHISEPTSSKQFFLNSHFCFFFVLGSMVSKNICKMRHKLKNAKNLPEPTWS